jgi:hypothetical protein
MRIAHILPAVTCGRLCAAQRGTLSTHRRAVSTNNLPLVSDRSTDEVTKATQVCLLLVETLACGRYRCINAPTPHDTSIPNHPRTEPTKHPISTYILHCPIDTRANHPTLQTHMRNISKYCNHRNDHQCNFDCGAYTITEPLYQAIQLGKDTAELILCCRVNIHAQNRRRSSSSDACYQ